MLWPPLGVIGLFVAVALFDVLTLLPGWLHLAVVVAFVIALAVASRKLLHGLVPPRREAARHRLERDSGLSHRPLSSLEDKLATPGNDAEAKALWRAHRARLHAQLARLRVRLPRPGLAAADPLALRGGLLLVLVVAAVIGHQDWRDRLRAAVSPSLAVAEAIVPAILDVWINPPVYTGLPPLFLDRRVADGADQAVAPVRIPAGSAVLAQVSAGRGTPKLVVGLAEHTFEPVGTDAYRISVEIKAGERIAVVQDEDTLGAWPIVVVADAPPKIEMGAPPARTGRAVLRLDYIAEDDYAVTSASAIIQRIDEAADESFEIELLLPGGDRRHIEHASYHDLTAHRWAGIHVDISLAAEDALGQRAVSYPVRVLLPERIFNHPVARVLVELRKQLTLDPTARFPVIRKLSDLYKRPQHFFHDLVVALAIRVAERRLIYDPSDDAVRQVQQLLWDTALHIEEGELAVAERDLRAIQEALMRALENNASDAEIARLMDQLQQALNQYLKALAEQLAEQLAEGGEPQPLPPDAELIGGDELRQLIERARQLSESGARDAARDLLAQLREMLENMQAGLFDQQLNQGSMGAWKMMDQLDNLMRRQQHLLDRSYQRSQGNIPQSGEGQDSGTQEDLDDSRNQESLRRALGRMMRELGDMLGAIPRPLGRAEQAMRNARKALERGMPHQAVDPQTRALDQMQQGMRAMAEQFMEQMSDQAGRGSGRLGAQPGQGRDPMGRRWGEGSREAVEGVAIPDQMEVQRAREILDELRRRRGDRARPSQELRYIDRLLRRF